MQHDYEARAHGGIGGGAGGIADECSKRGGAATETVNPRITDTPKMIRERRNPGGVILVPCSRNTFLSYFLRRRLYFGHCSTTPQALVIRDCPYHGSSRTNSYTLTFSRNIFGG